MGYAAVGFGADDLRLPAAELVSVAADVNGKPSVFVSANVGLFGFDQNITQTSRIVKAGGMRIGVTAILGKQYQKEVQRISRESKCATPEVALNRIVPELKRNSDYLVLLANATQAEAIELAKKFPDFNAVVVAEGPELPPHDWRTDPGNAHLAGYGRPQGDERDCAGLVRRRSRRFATSGVLLDSRFDFTTDARHRTSPEMKRLMAGYQDQLKLFGFAELGLRPAASSAGRDRTADYVGSQKCESCHEKSYDIWKQSGHAHAYETLETHDPPRNFDPECVSCHVVGWHPTKFFPYQGGFESPKKTRG